MSGIVHIADQQDSRRIMRRALFLLLPLACVVSYAAGDERPRVPAASRLALPEAARTIVAGERPPERRSDRPADDARSPRSHQGSLSRNRHRTP